MQLLPLPNCQRTASPGSRSQRDRRLIGVQPNVLLLVGRVRRPADQESMLGFPGAATLTQPGAVFRYCSKCHLGVFVYTRNAGQNRQPSIPLFSSIELDSPGPRLDSPKPKVCGDDRDRTGNLRLAKPALSQLSYSPAWLLRCSSGHTWIRTKDLSFIRAAL